MIPASATVSVPLVSIPRESGDDPQGYFADIIEDMYSPRERG